MITLEDIKKFLENNWEVWNDKIVIGNRFQGVWTEKNPYDAWRYQEIIWENKPDLIIECGSYKGGSALYLARLCDFVDNGRIISMDNRDNGQFEVKHPRVTFMKGDDLLIDIVPKKDEKVMIILDSDHAKEHIAKELEKYHKLVTPGQFLIVEDTMVNDGRSAVNAFLETHPEFEKLTEPLFTSNVGGYLRRK